MIATVALEAPEGWDDWLARQGAAAGFCQTAVWAAIDQEANGARPFFVRVESGGVMHASALIEQRGARPRGLIGRLAGRIGRPAAGAFECFEGPVVADGVANDVATLLLERIDELAATLGVETIRFHPLPASGPRAETPPWDGVFRARGYGALPWQTALVDLAPGEDEIMARFDRSAQRGIRRCREEGVEVRACASETEFVDRFHHSYYRASGHPDAARALHRSLAMWRLGQRHYRFFVAQAPEGSVLATLGTYRFNGMATEIMSARSALAIERRVPAQDLLHWEVFRAHKALGDTRFNLAGFSPRPETAREAGIKRFKEKWGGELAEVPRYAKGRALGGIDRLQAAMPNRHGRPA